MKVSALSAAMLVLLSAGAGAGAQEAVQVPVLSFDELHALGITSLVDKEFIVEGRLSWDSPTVKIPEDPRPAKELAALAGPPKVRIQGKSAEGLAGRDRLLLVSDKLSKTRGDAGVEEWTFAGRRLERDGMVYRLHVRLLLRASFKKELLRDPRFVRQSDQPKYWAQTFELELLGLEAATPAWSKGSGAGPV